MKISRKKWWWLQRKRKYKVHTFLQTYCILNSSALQYNYHTWSLFNILPFSLICKQCENLHCSKCTSFKAITILVGFQVSVYFRPYVLKHHNSLTTAANNISSFLYHINILSMHCLWIWIWILIKAEKLAIE